MELLSSLYRQYNGFMLGMVLAANTVLTEDDRYQVHKRRMREFCDELDVNVEVPEERSGLAAEDTATIIGSALHDRDEALYEHWFLGLAACGLAHIEDADPEMIEAIRKQFEGAAQACNVTRESYLRYVGAIDKIDPGELSWSAILDPGYELVESLISSSPPEDDTCFVAMPFSEEFAEHYNAFYRPALNKHGFRALRAWDGFGGEGYLSLLQTLMQRCGAVLVELSAESEGGCSNPNVIHETGLAHGLGRLTFHVVEQRTVLPGNLRQLANCVYSRHESWPDNALQQFDFCKAIIDAAQQYRRETEETLRAAAADSPYPAQP